MRNFLTRPLPSSRSMKRLCSPLAIYLACTASVPLTCPFLIDILRRHIAQVAERCRKPPGRRRGSADLAGRDACWKLDLCMLDLNTPFRGRVKWNSANHVLPKQGLRTEPRRCIRVLSLGQPSSTKCHADGQSWSKLQPEVWQGITLTSKPCNIDISGTRDCTVVSEV